MKLTVKTKKILKAVTISALALLEIYLIYATVASMKTFNRHPKFVADNGQTAQSSGYRTQFYLCLALSIVFFLADGLAAYFMFFKKPTQKSPVTYELPEEFKEQLKPDLSALSMDNINNQNDETTEFKPLR